MDRPETGHANNAPHSPADGRVEVRIVADAVAETDPRRVERILTNLVHNAVRHGAPPVTVEVDVETDAETDEDGAGPVVRVRDHGPGSHPTCWPSSPPPALSGSAPVPSPRERAWA